MHLAGVDAGHLRRFAVAAGHVDVAAELRVAEDEVADQQHDERDEADDRNAEERLPAPPRYSQQGGHLEDRLSVVDIRRQTRGDGQHRERHHERRDADVGDEEAVDQPETGSDENARRRMPQLTRGRANRRPRMKVATIADKGRDRGDAQVDLGAEQDEGDAGRGDGDGRDLRDHILHVARGQEDIGVELKKMNSDDQREQRRQDRALPACPAHRSPDVARRLALGACAVPCTLRSSCRSHRRHLRLPRRRYVDGLSGVRRYHACSIFFADPLADELLGDLPFDMTRIRSDFGQDRFRLGRHQDDRDALVLELFDQVEHLALGADVHAARRLVQDQHARLLGQPLRQHDLLLIAAAQVPGEHALDPAAGRRCAGRAWSAIATSAGWRKTGLHQMVEVGQGDVLVDLVARKERGAPVLGEVGDAQRLRLRRAFGLDRLRHRARSCRCAWLKRAEERPRDLGHAGARGSRTCRESRPRGRSNVTSSNTPVAVSRRRRSTGRASIARRQRDALLRSSRPARSRPGRS